MLTLANFTQSSLVVHTELSEQETRPLKIVITPRPAPTQGNREAYVRSQFDSSTPIDPEFAPTSPHAYTSDLELDTCKHSLSEEYMNESQHSRAWGHPMVK
jgi:hypothetical protein